MNETTNNGMTEKQLPKGLRQAVAATNQRVPDRESEARVIAAALNIPADQEPDVVVAKRGRDQRKPQPQQSRKISRWPALALPVALCLLLVRMPCDFEVELVGKLQPKERYEVSVEEAGTVVEIPAGLDHGSLVEKGVTLLTLQNTELEPHQTLTVKSPIRGQILNFQLRRTLMNRPLNRGDHVMTIANFDGGWIIDLNIPDDQMQQITDYSPEEGENYSVTCVLKSNPAIKFKGEFSRNDIYEPMTLAETDGHWMRVAIEVDEDELNRSGIALRPGAEVVVDVHCGRGTVGYVWSHKLIEFAQSNLFF